MTKQLRVDFTTPERVRMNHWLYVPDEYDSDKPCPLLVFLHGAGERGDDLECIKSHGPPKLIEQGHAFPCLVASPQCQAGKWWRPLAIVRLIDLIVENYEIDRRRIYLTGLSMGGYGTWSTVARYPERFAAIVPICGGGDASQVGRHQDIPTWAFHGANDPTVPVCNSERMVEALREVDGNVKFTVYPDAEHDSWTETYDNPEVFDWMLSQRRADAPVER